MKINRLRKRTKRRIYRIKNHSIWIKIHGEIEKRIREKFLNAKREKSLNAKREKSEIKNKIN